MAQQRYPWGNPATQNFNKQHLRDASHGDTKVRVHRLIWPLVDRLLIGFDQLGIDVTTVNGPPLDDPYALSFFLNIPADKVEDVREQIAPAKFTLTATGNDGDDGPGYRVAFAGSTEDATSLVAQLQPLDDEPEDVEDDEPEDAEPVMEPFGHLLDVGSTGDEVVFLQELLSAPVTGTFDADTAELLKAWQRRHYIEETGIADTATWLTIVPKRIKWLRPGATGGDMKVLQAAFRALGYQTSPVSGVWGSRFSRSIRLFQERHGLVQRSRIGMLEWDIIFLSRAELEANNLQPLVEEKGQSA